MKRSGGPFQVPNARSASEGQQPLAPSGRGREPSPDGGRVRGCRNVMRMRVRKGLHAEAQRRRASLGVTPPPAVMARFMRAIHVFLSSLRAKRSNPETTS
ncbi:hypothetical protein Plav_2163 [Parvibaculum lavamentivorans DS-1]|uniref:Uncharacterized protein n=1 Tax=Parvibaculum lavamentivorans (strain DS-1 / DSM 13023 / NCIMB 13966) TaxID=402881 RepID=A7HV44_PARL1|nr:hypothetical protein Plav_2163 [Parvibaculum lavamentivorans DS-1]